MSPITTPSVQKPFVLPVTSPDDQDNLALAANVLVAASAVDAAVASATMEASVPDARVDSDVDDNENEPPSANDAVTSSSPASASTPTPAAPTVAPEIKSTSASEIAAKMAATNTTETEVAPQAEPTPQRKGSSLRLGRVARKVSAIGSFARRLSAGRISPGKADDKSDVAASKTAAAAQEHANQEPESNRKLDPVLLRGTMPPPKPVPTTESGTAMQPTVVSTSRVQPDGQPDGRPDGEPDTQPDGQPDGQPDAQPDTQPDAQPDAQP